MDMHAAFLLQPLYQIFKIADNFLKCVYFSPRKQFNKKLKNVMVLPTKDALNLSHW